MASRIRQGPNNDERLFTVRPRTSGSVLPDKRGTPSSIRFNLPNKESGYADEVMNSMQLNERERTAFRKAIDVDGMGYIEFLMQSVSYNIQEKSQIMHTFGSSEAVYFYGRAPVMVQLTGLIIDDLDNDHFAKFLGLYHKFLRGSRAAEEYSYVTLSLPNAEFIGSFMGISINQNSDRETDITFSAQFVAKTFTIRSSDKVFADGEGQFDKELLVREPDPTLTAADINAIREANQRAVALSPIRTPSDPSNTNRFGSGKDEGFFGILPSSFGKLPALEGLIGFSAADITKFFDKTVLTASNLISPATNILDSIQGYSKSVIGIVDAVEGGLGDVLKFGDSVTKKVIGTYTSLTSTYTKIVNFPESISSKIGGFSKPGGSPLPIIGSPTLGGPSSTAVLSRIPSIGSTRGTPEGAAALSVITKATNQSTPLSPSLSIGGGGGSPGLSIGSGTSPSDSPVFNEPGNPDSNPGSPGLIIPDPSKPGGEEPPSLVIGSTTIKVGG